MEKESTKVKSSSPFEIGVPCTQFNVEDIGQEYRRLTKIGVEFSINPTEMGTAKLAVFNDTCYNHVQIVEILRNETLLC